LHVAVHKHVPVVEVDKNEMVKYTELVERAKDAKETLEVIGFIKDMRKTLACCPSKVKQAVETVTRLLLEGEKDSEKVVVVSEFDALLDLLSMELFLFRPLAYLGRMQGKIRNRNLHMFCDKDQMRRRLLLCNANIASHGINLSAATHMVLAEPFYTEHKMTQCVARMCRIGQRQSPNVYHLFLKGTLEQRLLDGHVGAASVEDELVEALGRQKLASCMEN
jgi:SNF2 family DNA or RNA helicase